MRWFFRYYANLHSKKDAKTIINVCCRNHIAAYDGSLFLPQIFAIYVYVCGVSGNLWSNGTERNHIFCHNFSYAFFSYVFIFVADSRQPSTNKPRYPYGYNVQPKKSFLKNGLSSRLVEWWCCHWALSKTYSPIKFTKRKVFFGSKEQKDAMRSAKIK